jgi:hypothetical protein
MTQLTDGEHKALMEDMRRFDEQMPCVGIFWYDPADKTLFGVRKQELTPKMVEEAAEKGIPFINYPKLHRQIWAKEYFKAQYDALKEALEAEVIDGKDPEVFAI